MSDIKLLLGLDLTRKREIPESIKSYYNLNWLYKNLDPFSKPSPDQAIDIQKGSGKRMQIIMKSHMKLPESFGLMKAAPVLKGKPEQKIEFPLVFKAG